MTEDADASQRARTERVHAPAGESGLWAAVLATAWADLFSSSRVAREESRRLFTDEHGDWAAHREFICGLAGFDAEAVREKALKFLALTDEERRAAVLAGTFATLTQTHKAQKTKGLASKAYPLAAE